jgi:hypothetical protein
MKEKCSGFGRAKAHSWQGRVQWVWPGQGSFMAGPGAVGLVWALLGSGHFWEVMLTVGKEARKGGSGASGGCGTQLAELREGEPRVSNPGRRPLGRRRPRRRQHRPAGYPAAVKALGSGLSGIGVPLVPTLLRRRPRVGTKRDQSPAGPNPQQH